MVDKKSYNVKNQIIISFLPVVWIIAYYRIEKVKMGLILVLAFFGLSIGLQMLLPYPYGIIVTLVVIIPISVKYIRKWTIEWNRKVNDSSQPPTN